MDVSKVLAKARDGDEASSKQLVERFYPAVRTMVHHELEVGLRRSKPWLASLFSTGDVVHDVFLRVLKGASDFTGDERDFEHYLSRAVVNRLIDAVRHHEATRRDERRIIREVLELQTGTRRLSPTRVASRNEELGAVDDALRGLTPRDRGLLELRLLRGMKYREIADKLGLPSEDAVRKATRTAEARLLLALRMRGVE